MGLPYNGWSDLVRHGRDKYYYPARDKGVLPAASECHGCRNSLPPSCVPYHAEEYGPTLEDYWVSCRPLCHRCHAMLHARFVTPNRWKRYLAQAAEGSIDAIEYPTSANIAPLLSKYKARRDIPDTPMPEGAPQYMKSLPLDEHRGPPKVAMLRIIDLGGNTVDVPDWKIYGAGLENLKLERPDFDTQAGLSKLKKVKDFPMYKPLYFPTKTNSEHA